MDIETESGLRQGLLVLLACVVLIIVLVLVIKNNTEKSREAAEIQELQDAVDFEKAIENATVQGAATVINQLFERGLKCVPAIVIIENKTLSFLPVECREQ